MFPYTRKTHHLDSIRDSDSGGGGSGSGGGSGGGAGEGGRGDADTDDGDAFDADVTCMKCSAIGIGFNGAETICGIAHILSILLIISNKIQICSEATFI